MGATKRKRGKRSYLVTVHFNGEREYKTVHSEQDAKALVQYIHKQELAGVNVVEAIRQARATRPEAPAPTAYPSLREALSAFIAERASLGEWTGSTPENYRRALAKHVYGFALPDGRTLGDVPVNEVTSQMLGAVLDWMRAKGDNGSPRTSMALREHMRCPLTRFYRDLIKRRRYAGPDPTEDLKEHMGRQVSKRARKATKYPYFTQEEAPALFAKCRELYPRHLAFVGCCALAGMRWGEAAGLEHGDILWAKGVIHLQRTWSSEARVVKDLKDHEDRYVPMARQLADWLRAHLEAMDLEGQMHRWTPEQRRLVFPNQAGNHLHHPTFLTAVWRPLLKAAGLCYRKPHATRHSFATWCLEGNEAQGIKPENILRVRDWMGHSSVEETERYAHVNSVHAGRTLDALGAAVTA